MKIHCFTILSLTTSAYEFKSTVLNDCYNRKQSVNWQEWIKKSTTIKKRRYGPQPGEIAWNDLEKYLPSYEDEEKITFGPYDQLRKQPPLENPQNTEQPLHRAKRILGGKNADAPGKFPHQVSLQVSLLLYSVLFKIF